MAGALRTIATMCPMNCHPTLCGMLVDVRDGHLAGVRGDKDNPDSQGFLCVRGQASRQIIGNPARLLKPLIRDRRSDDAWREAGWDEVLDLIAGQMTAAGREQVALGAATAISPTIMESPAGRRCSPASPTSTAASTGPQQ